VVPAAFSTASAHPACLAFNRAGYLVPIAKVGSKSALAKDPEGKLGAQFWSLCEKLVAEKS
jgi:hypothetical protein